MLLLLLLQSCAGSSRSPSGPSAPTNFSFDFALGAQGWQAGFSDYSVGQEGLDLTADYRLLPPSLGAGRSALFISGNNHSDDLFMFYKRRVVGLRPAGVYTATFEVEIATDEPNDCGGIGGSPGRSVFLKAGATRVEPMVGSSARGYVELLNVDKGNQATSGSDAVVIGTIENSIPCVQHIRQWQLKTLRSGSSSVVVQADDQGAAWLIVGTDSGFEGTTSIYYTRIAAIFSPM